MPTNTSATNAAPVRGPLAFGCALTAFASVAVWGATAARRDFTADSATFIVDSVLSIICAGALIMAATGLAVAITNLRLGVRLPIAVAPVVIAFVVVVVLNATYAPPWYEPSGRHPETLLVALTGLFSALMMGAVWIRSPRRASDSNAPSGD